MFRRIEGLMLGTGVVLFGAMLVSVCLQVFSRYVLQAPMAWTEEAARFLFVWASFLGAAVLVGRDEHFSIDLIVRLLGPGGQRFCALLTAGVTAAFSALMVWRGATVCWRLWNASSPVLDMSLGVVYAVIPLAGVYMLAHALRRAVQVIAAPAGARDAQPA